MTTKETQKVLDELNEIKVEELSGNSKRLYEAIMKIADERDKLKTHNYDLLKKLRNRVKEVKKLEKYSMYKKEFSTLNKKIEEKDKVIDLMSVQLTTPIHSKEWVKQYFENKAKEHLKER